jgi:hypothetical protein
MLMRIGPRGLSNNTVNVTLGVTPEQNYLPHQSLGKGRALFDRYA